MFFFGCWHSECLERLRIDDIFSKYYFMCVCLSSFFVCMCWNCRLAAVFISFMVQISNCLFFNIIFCIFLFSVAQFSCQEKEKFGRLMCFFGALSHWNCWHVDNGKDTQSLQSNIWYYYMSWLTESRLNRLHNFFFAFFLSLSFVPLFLSMLRSAGIFLSVTENWTFRKQFT